MLFKFIDGVIEQFHLMIPGKGRATTLIIGIDCNIAFVVCHNESSSGAFLKLVLL